jgi:cell division protein FtsL
MNQPPRVAAFHRLRAAVAQNPPVVTASPDVVVLARYLLVIGVIVAALSACVWARMAVRQMALELDATRNALARAETRHDRLLVERALLRDPGRLRATADDLALVAPVAVVDVGSDAK